LGIIPATIDALVDLTNLTFETVFIDLTLDKVYTYAFQTDLSFCAVLLFATALQADTLVADLTIAAVDVLDAPRILTLTS
jgi:hypothetical protein